MLRVSGGITDEGFSGSRVRDTENRMRFSKEGAGFLSSSIRGAIQTSSAPGMTNRNVLSQNISTLSESLGKNTEAVQNIIETQGDETRNEFKKLVDMMAASQKKTGDASIGAIKELVKQIEKIKIAAGDRSEELVDALSLQKTQDDLVKQLSRKSVGATIFEKVTSVDPRGQSILDSLKQTFSVEKMFGVKPSQSAVRERISAEMAQAGQGSSLADVVDATTVEAKVEKLKDSKQAEATKTATNAEGAALVSGIDRKSPQVQQVELLEDILEQLKKMEGLGDKKSSTTIIPGAIPAGLVTTLAAAVGPALMIGSTVGLLGAAAVIMWENWPGQDSLEDGPERTRRTAGGRETTTTAPLTAVERRNMEEYGTIDREEIQKIQMERAGYAQPEVVQSDPVTQLSTQEIQNSQKNNPAFIQAIKNMPAAQREAFLEVNPHMRSAIELQSEPLENTRQSTEPSMLTIPGSGVLSAEAQGMSPQVTPTADAVGNMSSFINDTITQIVNNIYNTNNTTGSGGAASVTVNTPMTARDTDPSFRVYQLQKLSTR